MLPPVPSSLPAISCTPSFTRLPSCHLLYSLVYQTPSCHLLYSLVYQALFLLYLVLPGVPGCLPVISCTPWYTLLYSCHFLYSLVYQSVFLSSLVLPVRPCSLPAISCTPWYTLLYSCHFLNSLMYQTVFLYLLYSLLDHAPFLPSLVLFVTL